MDLLKDWRSANEISDLKPFIAKVMKIFGEDF